MICHKDQHSSARIGVDAAGTATCKQKGKLFSFVIRHKDQHSSARIGVDAADAATHCLPATSKQRGKLPAV
jgi:hypothetical protein